MISFYMPIAAHRRQNKDPLALLEQLALKAPQEIRLESQVLPDHAETQRSRDLKASQVREKMRLAQQEILVQWELVDLQVQWEPQD
jgi:hypothetical protein